MLHLKSVEILKLVFSIGAARRNCRRRHCRWEYQTCRTPKEITIAKRKVVLEWINAFENELFPCMRMQFYECEWILAAAIRYFVAELNSPFNAIATNTRLWRVIFSIILKGFGASAHTDTRPTIGARVFSRSLDSIRKYAMHSKSIF